MGCSHSRPRPLTPPPAPLPLLGAGTAFAISHKLRKRIKPRAITVSSTYSP
jgi:hypothetical protein